jgi:excisionase family DNA binding protein
LERTRGTIRSSPEDAMSSIPITTDRPRAADERPASADATPTASSDCLPDPADLKFPPRRVSLLTAAEVASELRCSKAHVHNLINGRVRGARPLPSLWLGRRRLVRRTSLDQWLLTIEHGG